MDDKELKAKRILRTPSIFNWARILRPRTDDTCRQLLELAKGENYRSLRPAYGLCRKMALRKMTYESAMEKAVSYQGFANESSIELLDCLHSYLTENQIEVLADFEQRIFRHPLGLGPMNRMLTIPTKPDFVTIRGETLEPNFLLGWADDPFKLPQYSLIAGILKIAVLSRQDFQGSDARIITFRRDKWTGKRVCRTWLVSQFPDVPIQFINDEILRYNNALKRAYNEIMAG